MSDKNKYMMKPVNGNIVVKKYEYSEDVLEDMEEDTGKVLLPEEQQKKINLDKDGIYQVFSVPGDGTLELSEGDLVVIPNRTVGEAILMNGQEIKYAHEDRVIMIMKLIAE